MDNATKLKRRQWKLSIFSRDKYRCVYCRKDLSRDEKPTIDHDIPLSRGGSWDHSNLVTACAGCNNAKGSLTGEEFRRTNG